MQNQSSLSNNIPKYRIRYEDKLNLPQLQAVTTTEGPLLVITGAGSGKTGTLTYRVVRLVEDGDSTSSILLLTFIRKASQQMLRRAAELLDHRLKKVAGDTFHSFANITLQEHADSRLTLSTIHSTKGLEWHTVFIIWALDGRFPSPYALYFEEDLEEELRLILLRLIV